MPKTVQKESIHDLNPGSIDSKQFSKNLIDIQQIFLIIKLESTVRSRAKSSGNIV